MAITTLETERLRLRAWTPLDIDALRALHADPDVMRHQPDGAVPPEKSTITLATQTESWNRLGFGLWAVESKTSGNFIGAIGLKFAGHWPYPEVSWLLDKRYWNRGLATEGGGAALRYGFEKCGLDTIISITLPGNIASERVMQKLGMTLAPFEICPLRSVPVIVYSTTADDYL